MPLPASTLGGDPGGAARDLIAERHTVVARDGESFRRGVGVGDARGEVLGAAGLPRHIGEGGHRDPAPRRVQIEQTLGELGDLGDAAGDGHPRDRVLAQIFEHAADEIAHVDHGGVGQAIELLHRGLGGAPRGAGDMSDADRARHVDALMDARDPGGAGIGHHHAGGAEDREAAENAEPRIEGLGRELFAVGNRDLDRDIAGAAMRARHFGDGFAHHLARHGIDRGLSRRHRQPRQSHGAHTWPRLELHAASRRAVPHRGQHQRAMGHVGIVARILDHAGGRRAILQRRGGKSESDALSARQCDLDRVRERAGEQRRIGGLGRGRGASAGRPAAAERAWLVHGTANRTLPGACHRGGCRG